MIVFLAEDQEALLRKLMKRFIKSEVLLVADSAYKLGQVDVKDGTNHLPHNKVEGGYKADKILKQLVSKSKISERDVIGFHMEVKDFLMYTCSKILEKVPMKVPLVRNLACLNPKSMLQTPNRCMSKFKKCSICTGRFRKSKGTCVPEGG